MPLAENVLYHWPGCGSVVRILLVEDNEALRELFAAVFTTAGYQLHTARDGREALAWLASEKFDVLISDLWMPELDGPELCARVKEIDPELAAHTILITGAVDPPTRAFLAQNKLPYLLKPFEVKRLLELVERLARVASA